MDALLDYVEIPDDGWFLVPRYARDSQQALCSCALTCHAWRVRAHYLLWTFLFLFQRQQFSRFRQAIQNSPNITLIRGLMLQGSHNVVENPGLRMAGELFMHSFPHMEHFICTGVRFDHGPPLRVLRMRPPFFDSITSLELHGCTFQSLRVMLDMVWACSNLATLAMGENEIMSERYSAAVALKLRNTAENLRPCRKLTRLRLDANIIEASPSFLLQILRWLTTYYSCRNSGTPLTLD